MKDLALGTCLAVIVAAISSCISDTWVSGWLGGVIFVNLYIILSRIK